MGIFVRYFLWRGAYKEYQVRLSKAKERHMH